MSDKSGFQPMLAALVRELPAGDGLHYEPKWDGFRWIAVVHDDGVDMRSRHAGLGLRARPG